MPRRVPAIAVIVVLLVGAWVLDTRLDRPAPAVSNDVQTPMAARPGARSSAWFCTGATANADAPANGTVVIANAAPRPLSGTITVVPSEGAAKTLPLAVPASGRQAVKLTDVVTAPFASALVELDGGEAAVDLSASGALGETITPCASNASTTWFFAEGITTRDALEVVTLFNPFPEDAVVDLVFTTEEGEVTPQALTGLSVRGRGMTAINVGDHVQRRESVSTRISARAGRLVASRLQTFDGTGTGARKGLSVSLGAAAPGDVWYFPEGFLAEGFTEKFQIFNPANVEARVRVELALEQGEAEPIQLTVPPESRITLAANDEARIPKNVAHAVTVRSVGEIDVVVERTIDAVSPAPRTGLAITLGARVPATRWIVAAGQSDDTTDVWLVLQNPGSRPARVTVALLDGTASIPPSLSGIALGPGQRRAVKLTDNVRKGATPLLVSSDVPVVVERDLYRKTSIGTAMAPGIPLRA